MATNRFRRPLSRLVAGATVVGSSAVLLTAALVVPAGAAGSAPFNTKTSLTSSGGAVLQTGQPATFTAKVGAIGHGTPGGQVVFTITGADSSVANCDAGNTVALSGGTASCSLSGGLFAASGPYTVQAAYTDTVDSNFKPSVGSRSQTVAVGDTTTVLTSSVNPSVTGQGLSINAVVAASPPAAGSPTGSVTFAGVTCDGGSNTIVLTGGQAQCQIAGGLVGQTAAYSITGSYSGDPQFGASSGKLKQSVQLAATTVTLVPSAGSCTGDVCSVGQGVPISFVATAAATGTDGGGGTPAGSITFALTKPGSNVSLVCDGGTNTFVLNSGQATCTIAAGIPAIVYYTVTATLAATGYQKSVGTVLENSALASTNLTTSIPKSIGAGQSFDVTAVVQPTASYTGSNAPGGFVNILVCGNNSNGNNGCQGGAVPVGPGGIAALTIGGGEFPGVYSYQAVYTGDSNFYSSTARSKFLFIGKSDTNVVLSEPGGFFSVDGAAVAITATVVAPNGAAGSSLVGPPTGDVTFTITGPSGPVTCAGGNTMTMPINPGQVEGSVTCFLPPGTLTNSTPPTTTYSIQASYSGDSDYIVSNGHAVQVVAPVPS